MQCFLDGIVEIKKDPVRKEERAKGTWRAMLNKENGIIAIKCVSGAIALGVAMYGLKVAVDGHKLNKTTVAQNQTNADKGFAYQERSHNLAKIGVGASIGTVIGTGVGAGVGAVGGAILGGLAGIPGGPGMIAAGALAGAKTGATICAPFGAAAGVSIGAITPPVYAYAKNYMNKK